MEGTRGFARTGPDSPLLGSEPLPHNALLLKDVNPNKRFIVRLGPYEFSHSAAESVISLEVCDTTHSPPTSKIISQVKRPYFTAGTSTSIPFTVLLTPG